MLIVASPVVTWYSPDPGFAPLVGRVNGRAYLSSHRITTDECCKQLILARATKSRAPYSAAHHHTIGYLFLVFLDRTCIGFAGLTMNKDLGLSATQFGIGGGIFFLGYCCSRNPRLTLPSSDTAHAAGSHAS